MAEFLFLSERESIIDLAEHCKAFKLKNISVFFRSTFICFFFISALVWLNTKFWISAAHEFNLALFPEHCDLIPASLLTNQTLQSFSCIFGCLR